MSIASIKRQVVHSSPDLKAFIAGILCLLFITSCGQLGKFGKLTDKQVEPLAISLKTSGPVYFGNFDQGKTLGATEQQNFDGRDEFELSMGSSTSGNYTTTTETRVTLKNIDAAVENGISKNAGHFGGQVEVFMDGSVTNWIANIKLKNNVRVVGKTYLKTK